MKAYEHASRFFHACESAQGWGACREFVAPGATFEAQCEPLADIRTVEQYCEWMAAGGNGPFKGSSYCLNASAYDEVARTALFYGTFTARHVGEGGPVPPTGRETNTHYVYIFTMDADDRIATMVKVWNAGWAMRELGWT